jgi:hypothetical protein
VKKSKSRQKYVQARKDGSLGELWGRTSYSETRMIQWQLIRVLTAAKGYPTYDARHSKVPEREPS